jgi:hypothetical protein
MVIYISIIKTEKQKEAYERKKKGSLEYARRTKYVYQLAWQRRNPEKVKGYRMKSMAEKYTFYTQYKNKSVCSKCGFNDSRILEFHHINGEKKFSISLGLFKPLKELKEEIEKCIVLCPNCHRLEHLNRPETQKRLLRT